MFNFENGDINIMLSMINMKLRDEFSNLYDFVRYYDLDIEELTNKMSKSGYFYCEKTNQFKK